MSKRLWLSVLILAAMLAGCAAPPATTTEVSPAANASAEAAPATVEAPTTAPTTAAPTVAPTKIPRIEGHLIMATTTSTQDSGLLDMILPDFQKKTGITVDYVAVGSGQAFVLGSSGDADVLLVHDRPNEDKFVAAGDAKARYDVMYNDFVVVGPADDPAGIKGMKDATAAFKAIADKKVTFISRGDKSGTNSKELAIWKAAGITPSGDWYISAGQGMGEVLTMTDEQGAYTLSDRATYLKRQSTGLKSVVLVEGDKILFNPYGVLPVNPDKHPGVNSDLAQKFVDWITSLDTQTLIASYQINGIQLFTPDSAQWLKAHPQ